MTVDAAATAAVGDDIVIHLNDNPARHVHLRVAPSQYSLSPPSLLYSASYLVALSYILLTSSSTTTQKFSFSKRGRKTEDDDGLYIKTYRGGGARQLHSDLLIFLLLNVNFDLIFFLFQISS